MGCSRARCRRAGHLVITILLSLSLSIADDAVDVGLGGGALGISIGIGAQPSPPTEPAAAPPLPPAPARVLQPCDFPNDRLYHAYIVIQRFKMTITCDPFGVTATWTGADICGSYKGFYCDTPPGLKDTPTVAAVDFNGYHLAAPTLSGFVDQLFDLAFFHANSNSFAGQAPAISGLRYFYELDVSNNLLVGSFPVDVLRVAKIAFLDIRFNGHTGSLPPGLFSSFTDPEVILVNNNGFAGDLPANIGYSPVQYLSLANNKFTGPIPPSIGHAGDTLIEVLFLNNQLSGCLPAELGQLNKSTVLDAGGNFITGTIPSSFACLFKVQQLNLAHNLLYGEVPDALCRLACTGALLNLTLSYNYFTSVGSSCVPLIESGLLNVRKNCLPGCDDQRSPEECARFAREPKKCAPSTYVPCCPPPADAAAGDRHAAPSYATYAALEHRKAP